MKSRASTTIAILMMAKELIGRESEWVKNIAAAKQDGTRTYVGDREVYRFDISNAVRVAASEVLSDRDGGIALLMIKLTIDEHYGEMGFNSIAAFNDSSAISHRDVMNLFDEALKTAKKFTYRE